MITNFKLRVMMAILGMALATCPTGMSDVIATGHASNRADEWGPPTEGFALSVQVVAVDSQPGTPPQLKCVLKNVSRQVVRFVVGRPEVESKVTVTDERGQRVAVTERGRQMLNNRDYLLHYVQKLYPGQRYEEIYPVGLIYSLSAPGRYSVTVERSIPKRGWKGWTTVRSLPVELVVSPK